MRPGLEVPAVPSATSKGQRRAARPASAPGEDARPLFLAGGRAKRLAPPLVPQTKRDRDQLSGRSGTPEFRGRVSAPCAGSRSYCEVDRQGRPACPRTSKLGLQLPSLWSRGFHVGQVRPHMSTLSVRVAEIETQAHGCPLSTVAQGEPGTRQLALHFLFFSFL